MPQVDQADIFNSEKIIKEEENSNNLIIHNPVKEISVKSNNEIINQMVNIISMKFIRNGFNMLKSIDQLNFLAKKFNKINFKILKKEFLDKLKSQAKSIKVKEEPNEGMQVIKVKVNIKKFIKTNEELLDNYFSEWVDVINKKNIISLLINSMTLRKKQREDEEFVNKNRIIEALKKSKKKKK